MLLKVNIHTVDLWLKLIIKFEFFLLTLKQTNKLNGRVKITSATDRTINNVPHVEDLSPTSSSAAMMNEKANKKKENGRRRKGEKAKDNKLLKSALQMNDCDMMRMRKIP